MHCHRLNASRQKENSPPFHPTCHKLWGILTLWKAQQFGHCNYPCRRFCRAHSHWGSLVVGQVQSVAFDSDLDLTWLTGGSPFGGLLLMRPQTRATSLWLDSVNPASDFQPQTTTHSHAEIRHCVIPLFCSHQTSYMPKIARHWRRDWKMERKKLKTVWQTTT